jgi:hypothetical protein
MVTVSPKTKSESLCCERAAEILIAFRRNYAGEPDFTLALLFVQHRDGVAIGHAYHLAEDGLRLRAGRQAHG